MIETINGPINAVRLVGVINGKQKIITLYMDFHLDVTVQTQCDDLSSIDIHTYLMKQFKKVDKPIDFMFEINPTQIINKH
jgi:hypothetical protein